MPDDPELQVYDPFGKGGAGAPLRDKDGKIITQIYGKMNQNLPVSSASVRLITGSKLLSAFQMNYSTTGFIKSLLFACVTLPITASNVGLSKSMKQTIHTRKKTFL